MGDRDEQARIELLRLRFGRAAPGLRVGIGDDAAVLEPLEGPLVCSVDVAVEGVHFRRRWLTLADLGFKATMAAASDLAAMGARPEALLSSLILPAGFRDGALEELTEGQAEAADRLGCAVVGGNLSRGDALSITTTVLGSAAGAVLLRRGARAGDRLWGAGALGLAAAGLRALSSGSAGAALEPAIAAWRRPEARIAEGLSAVSAGARAAIDVSDGLSLDAARMIDAGLDLVIDAAALVSPPLAAAAAALGADPLELALSGGEDYALLAAAADPLAAFTELGRFEPGSGALWIEEQGARRRVEPAGYDHFASG